VPRQRPRSTAKQGVLSLPRDPVRVYTMSVPPGRNICSTRGSPAALSRRLAPSVSRQGRLGGWP
jgi:hypothetical protein